MQRKSDVKCQFQTIEEDGGGGGGVWLGVVALPHYFSNNLKKLYMANNNIVNISIGFDIRFRPSRI